MRPWIPLLPIPAYTHTHALFCVHRAVCLFLLRCVMTAAVVVLFVFTVRCWSSHVTLYALRFLPDPARRTTHEPTLFPLYCCCLLNGSPFPIPITFPRPLRSCRDRSGGETRRRRVFANLCEVKLQALASWPRPRTRGGSGERHEALW